MNSIDRERPILEVRDIAKTFGGLRALDGVSLALYPGRVLCLAGENGCGKSTLIKIMSGAEVADSGEIVIDGKSYSRIAPAKAMEAGIQVIYQDFSLFPNLSVAENIVLTAMISRRSRLFSHRNSRPAAEAVVADLDLDLDLDAKVEHLSVADRQLTAICRALANDARVIVMDEPTTALTHSEVARLFAIVQRLQERDVAFVFVSHKLEEALAISQDLTVLRSGRVVAEGTTDGFDRRSLAAAMTGRTIDESRRLPEVLEDASLLLETSKLGRDGAFADVSLSLRSGEILGITGLLGSGRTEIAESLFGVHPADAGTITIRGVATPIRSIRDAVAAGIAYVPEDRLTEGLFLDRSIADNIVAASLPDLAVGGVVLSRARVSGAISTLFERLRIKAPSAGAPVRSLSGGNAQRVVLAKWLATKPSILVLNGPTVGVDVGSKEQILDILREEAQSGMGVIVISDDVPELVSVCHRVLVVRRGRIVTELTGNDIQVANIESEMAA